MAVGQDTMRSPARRTTHRRRLGRAIAPGVYAPGAPPSLAAAASGSWKPQRHLRRCVPRPKTARGSGCASAQRPPHRNPDSVRAPGHRAGVRSMADSSLLESSRVEVDAPALPLERTRPLGVRRWGRGVAHVARRGVPWPQPAVVRVEAGRARAAAARGRVAHRASHPCRPARPRRGRSSPLAPRATGSGPS